MSGKEFFRAADEFLASVGFEADSAQPHIKDGHQLRQSLADLMSSGCASDGCCQIDYVQAVLTELKSIPQWTEEHAHSALEAAGFDPADFTL